MTIAKLTQRWFRLACWKVQRIPAALSKNVLQAKLKNKSAYVCCKFY